MYTKHYDLIIIGTGAGGGTLAYRLAQSGKKILILERGPFLPREKDNWNTKVVFNSDRYHNPEVWHDKDGKELHPGMSYFVGGNTKVYGAALFRLREKDFEAYQHKDGLSPAWPLKYRDFEPYYVQAEKLYMVALACGAVNSSVLMLRSANKQHPRGLANRSDLVGRHFMKHVLGSIIGVSKKPNSTIFQKTLSINDFYWGEAGYDYPMGQIQTLGKVSKEALEGNPEAYAPLTPEEVASHSIDWWLTTEDLPDPNNRVRVDGDKIILDYTENNNEPYDRLEKRWIEILKSIECGQAIMPNCSYFTEAGKTYTGKLPLDGVGHQVGTCRFGEDPTTSVLDLNCRTHDLDNLYVVDGSFFCSSGAVNPTLTIIANALRVGDHLLERMN